MGLVPHCSSFCFLLGCIDDKIPLYRENAVENIFRIDVEGDVDVEGLVGMGWLLRLAGVHGGELRKLYLITYPS